MHRLLSLPLKQEFNLFWNGDRTMTLHIRATELTAETENGMFGSLLHFQKGLNVISADNTKGKSTLLQAIIYGLGLEKMLSPRREIPLPRVMTVELQESSGKPEIPVLASQVQIEIENDENHIITLKRTAKGETDKRLVTVYNGPKLTAPDERYSKSDYYTFDPGSAQSSTGLQSFLVDFLGWDLPRIPRFNGGSAPLYLEALFSLYFVEQKVGWSIIPANFPTYLGLKDMARRSVEYTLGLTINSIEVERQNIDARAKSCKTNWTSLVDEANRMATIVSGRIEGIPLDPDLNWNGYKDAFISIPDKNNWVEIQRLKDTLDRQLLEEKEKLVPTASEDQGSVQKELTDILKKISSLKAIRHEILSTLNYERAQLQATKRQLNTITEDLQRHKDAIKILNIGGEIGSGLLADSCPTCHQNIDDTLLAPSTVDNPMNLKENREFLHKQKYLFENLLARSSSLAEKLEKELVLHNEEIKRTYDRSRALQDTLSTSSSTPSIASIQKRVELQTRIDNLSKVSSEFSSIISALQSLREEYRTIRSEEAKLPPHGLPLPDKECLTIFSKLLIEQLDEYGFSTFRPEDIHISHDNYRPIREGFEIGFELSASDAIRLKWAYQLAMLEATNGREHSHHPGLLIFDEPRQQETARLSFHSLIARASRVPKNLQIIFTTSEHKPTLRAAIEGLDLNLIDIPDFLLQRL